MRLYGNMSQSEIGQPRGRSAVEDAGPCMRVLPTLRWKAWYAVAGGLSAVIAEKGGESFVVWAGDEGTVDAKEGFLGVREAGPD